MAILKDLIGKLASEAYDASPLGQIPIIGTLAKEELTDLAKKLIEYFHDSVYQIQKRADEIMSKESAKSQEFVVDNAKFCFELIDTENLLTEDHYNAQFLAQEKADAYLKKQQYLNDEEKRLLKTYLSPLVEAAIQQLQLRLVQDPKYVNTAIGILREQIATLYDLLQKIVDGSNTPANPAILVEDISEELKNRWHDYPFLEQQRESGQKELSEFYKLPFGEPRKKGGPVVDLHNLLTETINSGDDYHERMLVILGAPGSGKTTVITYLLNNLRIDRPVRVYPLAEFINMNPANWPGELLARMGLVQENLCNSVLILDGLDELDLQEQYEKFVEKLRNTWAINNKIRNFTLILTCRTNRLNPDALRCNHVTLAPLSVELIHKFAADYLEKCPPELEACLEEKQNIRNVLGIPFLLYLVLGLGLTIDSGTSVAGLYDEIFSLGGNNSIYKRCYNQQKHPITTALAGKIHLFSQKVAVEMFSKKKVQEDLEEALYIPLAEKVIGGNSVYQPEDLLIGQYFLLGRKEKKIYFVHRSIFEYFVALSIFNALAKLVQSGNTPEQLYREMAPGKSCSLTPLAALLGLHHLDDVPEIKRFLYHLIKVHWERLSIFSGWAELMKQFFIYGMVDALPDYSHGGQHGITEEEYRFLNLLDISRFVLLKIRSAPLDLIPQEYHNNYQLSLLDLSVFASKQSPYFSLLHLVQYRDLSNLDLSCVNFYGINFSNAILCNANLSNAIFIRASLFGAILFNANLSETDFSGADLSGAKLCWANLSGAILSATNLSGTILPDERTYEDAREQDGEDVMLQFTDPERWNKLHPDQPVDPHRYDR